MTHERTAPDPAAMQRWDDICTRLRPFIARRVDPADVEDVLQSVLERMLRGLPTVRDDERWVSWIFSLTRNAITDHHRRRHTQRGRRSDVETDELAADASDDDEDDDIRAGAASCVGRFLDALPEPYRSALTLTELEGVSQREAAERLGVSYSGLKSRVQRGRDRLKALLTDCCTIELDSRRRVVDCHSSSACGGAGCSGPRDDEHVGQNEALLHGAIAR